MTVCSVMWKPAVRPQQSNDDGSCSVNVDGLNDNQTAKKSKSIKKKLGSSSTAEDVIEAACQRYNIQVPSTFLSGRVALVTGATSGIGLATAKALYSAGCDLILACRNTRAAESVAKEITDSTPNAGQKINVCELDLSDLHSVDDCVRRVKALPYTSLDILILNAGMVTKTWQSTKQGIELGFGVNFVGHYRLCNALLPLVTTSTQGRIVGVSSVAHWMGKIRLDDLNLEKERFSGFKTYGQSKLAMILYMKYLAKTLPNHVKVYSVHPGAINTNLNQGTTYLQAIFDAFSFLCKSEEQGAATTVFAATMADSLPTGSYLQDCGLGRLARAGRDDVMAERLVAAVDDLIDRCYLCPTPADASVAIDAQEQQKEEDLRSTDTQTVHPVEEIVDLARASTSRVGGDIGHLANDKLLPRKRTVVVKVLINGDDPN